MGEGYNENLRQALDTLRTHKLRSALTVFGVVLGVRVIMLVAALISGFDQKIQENIKQFGADTAFITKWDQGRHGGPPPLEERQRKPLTVEDARAIQERCPAVKAVTTFLQTNWDHAHTVRTKDGQVSALDVRGVQPCPKLLDQAVDQIREVLERRRNVPFGGKDNFSIATAEQQVEEFHNIVGKVALATVVLSSIGLLVGGIGVMNIMLVSVTERTREIGVRKAIGAKRGDITWQFLLEAMTLTGAGGVIALVLVNALVLLIRVTLKWPGAVPVWAAATGVAVSVSIGLIFGVWPAMKAAKLDPVEALRYE